MKSISDLEKRHQKSFGGFIRELGEKAMAKARAKAKASPEILFPTTSNITELDSDPYRYTYKKGGKVSYKSVSDIER
jgi:hypothetical protein